MLCFKVCNGATLLVVLWKYHRDCKLYVHLVLVYRPENRGPCQRMKYVVMGVTW